jgi:hypothetical protein
MSHYAGVSRLSWPGKSNAFLANFERRGPGFAGAPLSIQINRAVGENFRNSGRFGIKPGTLQKLLRQTSLPASPQYGLQIAEGMLTFFESYERELEKCWTKMLFFLLS